MLKKELSISIIKKILQKKGRKQKMILKIIRSLIVISVCVGVMAPATWSGNKRIMTIRAAKVMAERAIVESIYGLKLRATEEVKDMIPASFEGSTETKTQAEIKGIQYDEIVYDQEKDIAKVTASVTLDTITNIDGKTMNLKNKVFKRVGFATSTPEMAGPIRALRAAELDAYKQLIKQIVGFTLESQTKVENYMLKSDLVKTKVLATLYLAELKDYGWDKYGDAYVKMELKVSDISEILGEGIIGGAPVIEVEGQGSQEDDFKAAQESAKKKEAQESAKKK
jgi:hypothetical protein